MQISNEEFTNLPPGKIFLIISPEKINYSVILHQTLSDEQRADGNCESLMVLSHGLLDMISNEAEKLYFRGSAVLAAVASGKPISYPETITDTEEKVEPQKLN